MIRFARLQSDGVDVPAGLAPQLAAAGDLDWLQVDYVRPGIAEASPGNFVELPDFARGFADALREVRKSLYLEPRLHVVASAGWADSFACVEHAAGVLNEGGCGELPVAAVRGSNLLPILEMLVAAGVKLAHAESGAPFRELHEPLLAADLQLGAGPLATAFAEGARIVVAGCFDSTAPLTASAVNAFGWGWSDYDQLAGAAMAAEAAGWSDWRLDESPAAQSADGQSLATSHCLSLNQPGESTLELTRTASDAMLASLRDSLLPGGAEGSPRAYADVDCRDVQLAVKSPTLVHLGAAAGAKPDGTWRLEILYQTGFAAETLVEFLPGVHTRLRRRIADVARRQLQRTDEPGSLVTVEELHCAAGRDGVSWLHVAYQSKSRKACERFVEQLLALASAHRTILRLATGRPAVHVHCGVWPTRIPRDAVDIAVETRLAKEWV